MPTPGSTAPVPSVTRPKISPVLIWALAGENAIATTHTKHAIRNSLIRILRDYTTRAKRRESVKMSVERIKCWFHNRFDRRSAFSKFPSFAARGETPPAFGRRCIPPALAATADFHHGLLGGSSVPKDVLDDEPDVRGALREPAHVPREPVLAVRNQDAQRPFGLNQPLLKRPLNPIEHRVLVGGRRH